MHTRWPQLALALILLALLGACSSLRLGYDQLPRLASWWVDDYVEFDRAQQAQFDSALAGLQQWHRREELPRWLALLASADAMAERGQATEADLAALDAAAGQTVARTLAQAAPLAAPLLASLRPAQWQALEAAMANRHQNWLKEQGASPSKLQATRSQVFSRGLGRWLGSLDPRQRDLSRQLAAAWPVTDAPALAADRVQRQALTLQGLRTWAAAGTDAAALQRGTDLLLQASGRGTAPRSPAAQAQRERVQGDVLQVLNAASPAQWQKVRAHWAQWRADLQRLQAG
jgi:hypothetical protein